VFNIFSNGLLVMLGNGYTDSVPVASSLGCSQEGHTKVVCVPGTAKRMIDDLPSKGFFKNWELLQYKMYR
jgi:hypothetical protein